MIAAAPTPRVVWSPLPGSQALALTCPCNEILYHGTRGPGKTDWQLMRFRMNVGRGYGRFWRGVIFDREYKNLDDLVVKSKRWFAQFGDGAKWLSGKSDYKWVWPTGEELLFRHGCKEEDYDQYHGHEYPFIGFNELTKQPTPVFYNAIKSCNRSSFLPLEHSPDPKNPLPEIPLEVCSTTNPYGPGHSWVKNRFINKAPGGEMIKQVSLIFNPRTQKKEEVTRTLCHIFGSYRENRFLAPEYIAVLDGETDPNKRKAWLEGDWDVVAGGALDDVWRKDIHVLPRFSIPKEWILTRSLDWGSTQPFSVGFWAETDGGEVELPNGRMWSPPKGSKIRFAEIYGTREIGSNEGLKLSSSDVAKLVLKVEQDLFNAGWIETRVQPGAADNAIRNVNDKGSDSIEKKMHDEQVFWTASDKRPGSRKVGLQLVRDMLEASIRFAKGIETKKTLGADGKAKPKTNKCLYFMENCRAAISTLPVLPRDIKDPDDVDTESEDHVYDDVRYEVTSGGNRVVGSVNVKHAT